MYQKGDYIFDGFAHRPFDPDFDGWRNELPQEEDYPAVEAAHQVIRLFNDLCDARKRIWELERRLEMYAGKSRD